MTLAEFIQANTGRYLDFDGKYGAQCVDLVDFYVRDVLGDPIVWANAIDWYGKLPAYYQWIPNQWGNTSQFPAPGDVIVWHQDTSVGTGIYGHIAVCVTASGLSFTSFDQNWPAGSPCHLQKHDYRGVTGWARAIAKPAPPPPPPPDPCAAVSAQLAVTKGDLAVAIAARDQAAARVAAFATWIQGAPK
jgi:hypothetical protein